MSNCQRNAKECQKFRKEMSTKLPKEKFSECLEQTKALCHTVVAKIPQRGIPLCFQQVADYETSARQIRAKEDPAHYEISTCAPW